MCITEKSIIKKCEIVIAFCMQMLNVFKKLFEIYVKGEILIKDCVGLYLDFKEKGGKCRKTIKVKNTPKCS